MIEPVQAELFVNLLALNLSSFLLYYSISSVNRNLYRGDITIAIIFFTHGYIIKAIIYSSSLIYIKDTA